MYYIDLPSAISLHLMNSFETDSFSVEDIFYLTECILLKVPVYSSDSRDESFIYDMKIVKDYLH